MLISLRIIKAIIKAIYNISKLKIPVVCHVERYSMNFYMPLDLVTSKFEVTETKTSKSTKKMWKPATGSIMKNWALGFVLTFHYHYLLSTDQFIFPKSPSLSLIVYRLYIVSKKVRSALWLAQRNLSVIFNTQKFIMINYFWWLSLLISFSQETFGWASDNDPYELESVMQYDVSSFLDKTKKGYSFTQKFEYSLFFVIN